MISQLSQFYSPVLARKHAQANVEKNKAGQQGENEVITALWQPFYLLITEVVLASICVYLAIL